MEAKFFSCTDKWRPLYDISNQLRKEVSCWAILDETVTVCGPAIGNINSAEIAIPKEVINTKGKCYLVHTHPRTSPLSPPSVEDFQLLQQLKISETGILLTSEGVYKFTTSDSQPNDINKLHKILTDVCLAKKSLTDWHNAIAPWTFELYPWSNEIERKDLSGTDIMAIWRNRLSNTTKMSI